MTQKESFLKQVQICERAEKLGIVKSDKRIMYMIDIGHAVNVFNMDVEQWLAASDTEFSHEFVGICTNIDREKINETHKADAQCFGDFVPRFGRASI